MSSHKFRVGETVDFKPGRMGFPAASRECTIVRLLPIEGGNLSTASSAPPKRSSAWFREASSPSGP